MADTIVTIGSASSNFSTSVRYSIWIGSQTGERKRLISNFIRLNIVLALNKYHWMKIIFPASGFPTNLLIEDAWLEVWRGVESQAKAMVGESPFLLVDARQEIDTSGREVITVTGFSAAYIMHWAIVAYNAGTSQSAKTDYADDMIKEIADENVGSSATDTDRDMSSYLTIETDNSSGVSLTKGFARRHLDVVFSELCDASAADGTRLYWDVVLSSPGNLSSRTLELRTYKNHRGDDRGLSSVNQMIFSVKRGNLENVWRKVDYRDTINYAYGLGQDVESSRNVQTASDSTRINASPWGRIKEGVKNATFSNSDAGVTAEAKALLRQSRPRLTVAGKIKITPNSLYGVHYNFGDLVVVESFGNRDEAMIAPVDIRVSDGEESIDAYLRVEE
jgi:hypothetical protein